MILNLLITIGVLVGLVLLVVWAVRRLSKGSFHSISSQSARDIAQARYARGEISREEYQQIISDLSR
ncbi:SHOCT domain-containing protein [Anaerolinea sp.]|uniref:SHOCT domain-containing protein n=1 Tax=Anaerolinea sp. TaxID=1872519 RepID=UPI002ACEC0F0|nr:SHOCT domain-containing protein [Anaerolinea sp.]